MTTNLFLVLSEKPTFVSTDEYHRFYAEQAQKNISTPGFVSAQRYAAREVLDRNETGLERHLAAYEYEGDMSTWQADHTRRFGSGDWPLPNWFSSVNFATWNCLPIGERLRPNR